MTRSQLSWGVRWHQASCYCDDTLNTGDQVSTAVPRMAIAVLVPPVLTGIFIPIFRQVQSSGRPRGSVQGIDLTTFAQRDERMLFLLACIFCVFVAVVGIGVRPWRRRLTIMLVAGAVALIAYATAFVALFAE